MTSTNGPAPGELPPALAELPIEALVEMEKRLGRPFGNVVDELASGNYSIDTMRELVRLVAPDRELVTLGDLIEAAGELLPKGTSPGQP